MTRIERAVWLDFDAVDDAEYNPRTITRPALAGLSSSISEFGQVEDIVVNRRTVANGWDSDGQMVIVGGHQRKKAIINLGAEGAHCTIVELNAEREEALNIALNNPHISGEWTPKISELLDRIQRNTPTLFSSLQMGPLRKVERELARVRKDAAAVAARARGATEGAVNLNVDTAPPVVSEPGVVYELGPHRLMYGDSTKADDVARLLDGQRPPIVVSDPPYGVQYGRDGAGKKNAIMGDLTQATIPIFFAVMIPHLDVDARIYLCGGTGNFEMYRKLFDHHLHQAPHMVIWNKGTGSLRHNHYHSQFEFIYWGWLGVGGSPEHWHGDRKETDIWDIKRDARAAYIHPTQKPVEVMARPIRNHCPPGGIVFEPFSGSASTIIGSAQEGRRCYAMELDGRYVDAGRRRWTHWAKKNDVDPGPGALDDGYQGPTAAPSAEPDGEGLEHDESGD